MTRAPLILAFDTSGPHCLAALCHGDALLKEVNEPRAKGQAERLMPLLEELLSAQGLGWPDLSALAVGIGPGNFTGIRIAVAAARGLALGLRVPAVGVSGFEARALLPGSHAIPAPRDQAYFLDSKNPRAAPQRMERTDLPPDTVIEHAPEGLAQAIAGVAGTRWHITTALPAPLYLRAADAAPSRDIPPKILDP